MIHFHGGPITPDTCALRAWKGRHAFISFASAGQLALASEVTQSFALDNGAFSFWTKKRVVDWNEYYAFVAKWMNHPRFSFAVIPDVIGGTSEENDALIAEWPHGKIIGAPVYHFNEPDERFIRLCHEFPRVCIGPAGRNSGTSFAMSWTRTGIRLPSCMACACSMPTSSATSRCRQLTVPTWPEILASIKPGRNLLMRRPAKRLARLCSLSVSSQ